PRLVVRQALPSGAGGRAAGLGRDPGGTRRRAARGEVAADPAARARGVDRRPGPDRAGRARLGASPRARLSRAAQGGRRSRLKRSTPGAGAPSGCTVTSKASVSGGGTRAVPT